MKKEWMIMQCEYKLEWTEGPFMLCVICHWCDGSTSPEMQYAAIHRRSWLPVGLQHMTVAYGLCWKDRNVILKYENSYLLESGGSNHEACVTIVATSPALGCCLHSSGHLTTFSWVIMWQQVDHVTAGWYYLRY